MLGKIKFSIIPVIHFSNKFLQLIFCNLIHGFSCASIYYLTIIPRARMGYESIAHVAEGRMDY